MSSFHITSNEQVMGGLTSATTRYTCPIESCGWHYDETPTADLSLLGTVPLAELAAATARRSAEVREDMCRRHLDSHDAVEYATEIHRLRTKLAAART